MILLGRTDTSVIGRWWWTVDRWTMAAVAALVAVGALLIMAASPAVAERIGADHFHFVRRQFIFLPPALLVIFAVSLLSPKNVRRLACLGFLGALVLMAATLFSGQEIKGATRWVSLAGISIQPSEFVKPTFAVVSAWMFAEQRLSESFPGNMISLVLYLLVACLLLLQPDVGMTLVVSAVWFVEFFLAGLPIVWVLIGMVGGLAGLVGAYFTFSHVASRIDRFLDPSAGDSYQVTTALQAFRFGGFFGRGPGEGRVKAVLPDAHTDFIMAVAGEEFGLILCLLVVGIFAFIVLRGFSRMLIEENLFILLATSGLLVQFGLQAIINMASTLHLMPTKGMTLPFISYGGSSMLALALGMGMVLALTRKRYGREGWE
ncbi:putative peptidoglycan glycosyltransferase FtsW [Telmatospirillum sp.]|uniref:FtsW/RodA/SpoVE family cell cycle protein n=1 Tax=Telmatospirillum sp. TaxID=2079197 RepID=UPI00284406A5|nr:putative peptidoglycan glycosyltransferase FtsW [Telmatospirillum sp.]MDR3435790.1 putative peptidoglycan glycosyltransferase FtsW [Telmatospirillum sp.]